MLSYTNKVDEINNNQWKELLHTSQTRSFFQTRECYDLYAANPEFMQPFCVAVENERKLKGVVIGYIQRDGGRIKQFFSRRAIINGGPLLADDISEEALTLLLIETKKLLQGKAIYVESRNFEDFSTYKNVFARCGFEYVPHLNFHVDTTSLETINSNISKSRKRNIRLSFRDGIEVVDKPTINDVRDFYSILHALYRDKVKTPLFPLSFFEYLFNQDYARFFMVKYDNRLIGGRICVFLKGYTLYDWFACGEDGVYKNIYPSSVATYSSLIFAAKNNISLFDFMGAGKPNEDYGVRDFKASYGGILVEHGRFQNVIAPVLYRIGKLAVSIFKKT